MLTTHAVGIDLGTTYSCIAYLNERGEPITLNNHEGEQCTPSVVMYEDGEAIVGTEAARNAIAYPDRVVQNAKRWIGDPKKRWTVDGKTLSPVDVSAAVLKKLLKDASTQIGPIERAVITVPAQFSDLQRQATVQAGLQAGLKQVDIINEPVAAALCYVLGKEGLWFAELAEEQKILVYDLGGGTFDLSLVKYQQNEVRVIASSGDLRLGGIDWNAALLKAVADQFTREFQDDPRKDAVSLQAITNEVEQCKRALSTRPRASLICQHNGKRKTYQIELEQFNQLTAGLVARTEEITKQMLKDNKMGWAHVNVVLTTGGSSRMPSVRSMLQKLSGRTLNTSLSPDQAIAHGAACFAGMLISKNEFAKSIFNAETQSRLAGVNQQSVSARSLGIFVRDEKTKLRVPHYMIPANTPLPTSVNHVFGTVVPNQRRVVLRIVESGTSPEQPCVEIGDCTIDGLPPDLPIDSNIQVTISYDASAKIHVSAKDVASGKEAQTQIVRAESVVTRPASEDDTILLDPAEEVVAVAIATPPPAPSRPASQAPAMRDEDTLFELAPSQPSQAARPALKPVTMENLAETAVASAQTPKATPTPKPAVKPAAPSPRPVPAPGTSKVASKLEESAVPIPLCNECGEPLSPRGICPACGPTKAPSPKPVAKPAASLAARPAPVSRPSGTIPAQKPRSAPVKPAAEGLDLSKIFEPDDDDILELPPKKPARPAASSSSIPVTKPAGRPKSSSSIPVNKPASRPGASSGSIPTSKPPAKPAAKPKPADDDDDADFWRLPD